jgi:hypothetical protein
MVGAHWIYDFFLPLAATDKLNDGTALYDKDPVQTFTTGNCSG